MEEKECSARLVNVTSTTDGKVHRAGITAVTPTYLTLSISVLSVIIGNLENDIRDEKIQKNQKKNE